MLSLIEVQCPHCGARGQVMLPPVGTIIIGPCPHCQGLVVIFCGCILPLSNGIMCNGTIGEKRDHMLSVLTEFLKERIAAMITDEEPSAELEVESESAGPPPKPAPVETGNLPPPLTSAEFNALDNSKAFKAIFG